MSEETASGRARSAIDKLRRRIARRTRLELHLRLSITAAGLVVAPILAFSLGSIAEASLWTLLAATLVFALVIAEYLFAGNQPTGHEAAARLDALTGDRALFASAMDARLDQNESAIGRLFQGQLDEALLAIAGRDPLPRPNFALVKILAALLVLDAAMAAVPAPTATPLDPGLDRLRDFVIEAGERRELAKEDRAALSAIAAAADRREILRRSDALWQKEQERKVDAAAARVDAMLAALEGALAAGDAAAMKEAAERLPAAFIALDAAKRREVAERLRALAKKEPENLAGINLDELARAAEGAGAGLGASSTGTAPTEEQSDVERVLVALYDGLGSLPPSGSLATSGNQVDRRRNSAIAGSGPNSPSSALDFPIGPTDRALVERYFRLRAR